MIYGIIAAVCFLLALGIMGMYYMKKKREEERKGFFVIAGTILFVYLFPSAALFIIGLICLLIFLGAIV